MSPPPATAGMRGGARKAVPTDRQRQRYGGTEEGKRVAFTARRPSGERARQGPGMAPNAHASNAGRHSKKTHKKIMSPIPRGGSRTRRRRRLFITFLLDNDFLPIHLHSLTFPSPVCAGHSGILSNVVAMKLPGKKTAIRLVSMRPMSTFAKHLNKKANESYGE